MKKDSQAAAMREVGRAPGAGFARRRWRAWSAACAVVILAGCAASTPAPVIERPSPGATGRTAPPATVPPLRTDRPEFYAVRPGDTLRSIAAANGTDARTLAELNQLADANRLQVGQVIRLRPATTAAAPAPAPAPAPADEGVQINTIGGVGSIESRPLEGSVQSRPLEPPPADARAAPSSAGAPAAPAPGATLGVVKSEPRAFKLPYSEENLALVQRGEAPRVEAPAAAPSVTPAPAVPPKPEPPKPDASASAPPVAPADAPRTRPDANDRDRVDWLWPAAGRVVEKFEGNNKGVDISAKVGEPVTAAAPGRVMYAGSGLRGYGQLIIIKHNETYLSAYAHNSRLLVKEGQSVTRGQKIAEVGQTDADRPKLHFEIRRAGRPVDPLDYLPPRD